MEQHTGSLVVWKDDKGFGFIKPADGSKDLFVHIRDFGSISRKPRIGDTIHYQPIKGHDGRLRAADVSIAGVARYRSPTKPHKRTQNRPSGSSSNKHKGKTRLTAIVVLLIGLGAVGVEGYSNLTRASRPAVAPLSSAESAGDSVLQRAYQRRQSDLQVSAAGTVSRILPDDLKGSRHQRFLVRMASGQTILIAHNIDLAPRINSLKEGDYIRFNGEYEWNNKGGVVHWTHHDPGGRHIDGWLIHAGRKYQ